MHQIKEYIRQIDLLKDKITKIAEVFEKQKID